MGSSTNTPWVALGGSILILWLGYATVVFPGSRKVTWVELATDGFSPDWVAADAQGIVGQFWWEGARSGFFDEIGSVVTQHLAKWGGGDVLELAAGSGSSSAVWHDFFQKEDLCTRTILTDLQPKIQYWDALRNERKKTPRTQHEDFSFECGTFSYIASPVDATQAQAALEDIVPMWGLDGKEIRMIHLALHHFEPNLVHEILEDATRSGAAVLIVDHDPNTGGSLYNGFLAVKHLVELIPSILLRNPIKLLLVPTAPLILAATMHDATVSILRSYSKTELKQLLRSTEEGKDYNIQTFESASYGDWIGVPSFLRLPYMDDPVMNFVFATPPAGPLFHKRHHENSQSEMNGTVEPSKVYGTPVMPEPTPVPASMQIFILLLVGVVSYKTLIDDKSGKRKKSQKDALGHVGLTGEPAILGIGTANPPYKWTSEDVDIALDWKRTNVKLGDDFVTFMKRIHKTSGVESRYVGIPPMDLEKVARGERPEGIYGKDGIPSVSERQTYWAEWAPKMAIQASSKALEMWGGNKDDITHVIFHSCTGFKAPGVELDVVDALNLTNVRRRLGINYMGCFGGFTGMAVAKAFCEADPKAVVLVVCAETCYSHIAFNDDRSKTIGNCFFADGAGAAIIGAGKPGDWAISGQQTITLGTETRDLMTWRPNDSGYDMYLDKKIGYKFGMHLYWNLKSYLAGVCNENVNDIEWCVHPGGKGILDFFCSDKLGLGITKATLERSYGVLRRYGNMSSGTIFFVLKDMLNDAREHPTEVKPTAVCFGFGPGLTLEIAELRRIGSDPTPS